MNAPSDQVEDLAFEGEYEQNMRDLAEDDSARELGPFWNEENETGKEE